ncbi:hypothetical protein D3C75_270710 [compost metagenome]
MLLQPGIIELVRSQKFRLRTDQTEIGVRGFSVQMVLTGSIVRGLSAGWRVDERVMESRVALDMSLAVRCPRFSGE